jgi:hypothetical protein
MLDTDGSGVCGGGQERAEREAKSAQDAEEARGLAEEAARLQAEEERKVRRVMGGLRMGATRAGAQPIPIARSLCQSAPGAAAAGRGYPPINAQEGRARACAHRDARAHFVGWA